MEQYSNSLSERKPIDQATGFPEIPKKEDKPKTEPILDAPAIVKKKTGLRRLKSDFIESEITDVKESIFMDIVMPAIKNTIADGISTFVDMMLFGDSGRPMRSRTGKTGRVPYNSMWDNNPRNKISTGRSRVKIGMQIDDVIVPSRVDAEKVIRYLQDYIEEYGMVPVSELYDAVGYDTRYTDHNFGWYDISGYSISRVREGFLLELPDPKPLEK